VGAAGETDPLSVFSGRTCSWVISRRDIFYCTGGSALPSSSGEGSCRELSPMIFLLPAFRSAYIFCPMKARQKIFPVVEEVLLRHDSNMDSLLNEIKKYPYPRGHPPP